MTPRTKQPVLTGFGAPSVLRIQLSQQVQLLCAAPSEFGCHRSSEILPQPQSMREKVVIWPVRHWADSGTTLRSNGSSNKSNQARRVLGSNGPSLEAARQTSMFTYVFGDSALHTPRPEHQLLSTSPSASIGNDVRVYMQDP
jgi:hypothetical protein